MSRQEDLNEAAESKLARNEATSETAIKESFDGKDDLIRQQREEMLYQKNPDRAPTDTTNNFGRMEISGDEGQVLVKGAEAKSLDPLERIQELRDHFEVHDRLANGTREDVQRLLASIPPEELKQIIADIEKQLKDANSPISVSMDEEGRLILLDRNTGDGFQIGPESVVAVKRLPDGTIVPNKEFDWSGKNDEKIAAMLERLGKDAPATVEK